jgi:hypothetical protein
LVQNSDHARRVAGASTAQRHVRGPAKSSWPVYRDDRIELVVKRGHVAVLPVVVLSADSVGGGLGWLLRRDFPDEVVDRPQLGQTAEEGAAVPVCHAVREQVG